MWITRRQYNELHKSQSDYRDIAYNLELENESLSDGIDHLKKEQEITLERYNRTYLGSIMIGGIVKIVQIAGVI
jgi:hypothetical protein